MNSSNTPFAKTYLDDWDEEPIALPTRPAWMTIAEKPTEPLLPQRPEHRATIAPVEPPPLLAISPAATIALPMARTGFPIPLAAELWHFPSMFARSAIFRVGRDKGLVLPAQEIATYARLQVVFEGPRLTMRDKRIWELAVAAAKRHGFSGEEFELSLSSLARALGAAPTGAALRSIGASLKKLTEARIKYVIDERARGDAALLGSFSKRPGSGWWASLDPGLQAALFEDLQFPTNLARRERLSTDLARWLHDFFATHKKGYEEGIPVETLRRLCGYDSEACHFPKFLRGALTELTEVAPELIAAFRIQPVGRHGKNWKAFVTRGSEVAAFKLPAEDERRARARASHKAKGAGRGRVAL